MRHLPGLGRLAAAGAALAGLAVLFAVAGGCGRVDVTGDRLQGDLGPTFEHLYVVQQRMLGRGEVNPPIGTSAATCDRGGPTVPDRGPGDWVCRVRWPGPDGVVRTISYDVRVLPTGCYTAQGPPSFVGQQTMSTPDGRQVTNPLYEFDGCFDTT